MAGIGTAIVFINGRTDGLNKALGDAEQSVQKSMGNIIKLGQRMGAGMAVAGAGILGFLGMATGAAAESEQAQAGLAQVLKSTGGAAGMTADALNKMAEELSKATPFEDDAITKGQSLLLTFTKIGKDVFPQATETMLDMSQALGQDMQSSAIQLGKALNDPVNGVTALQRVGVSFTEQQKAQIKALVQSGDVMGAQKMILRELATEFGGQARAAAETFTGKLQILKNTGGNLMELIGNQMIPILQRVMNWVTPIAQKTMDWVSAHQALAEKIVRFAAVGGGIMTVLGPVLIALPGIVTGFKAFGTALAFMSGPLGLAVGGVALFYKAYQENWLGVRDVTNNAWTRIKAVFAEWRPTLIAAGEWMAGAWATIREKAVGAFQGIRQAFSDWYQEHRGTIIAFAENVRGVFVPLWERVRSSFVAAWGGIKAFWAENGPLIQQAFSVVVNFIAVSVERFMQFWNEHWETIKAVFEATWETMADVVKIGWDAISGTAKLGMQLFAGDWSGAWDTVKGGLQSVWDGIKGVVMAGINYIKDAWNSFSTWLENKIEGLLLKIPGAQTLTDVAGWAGRHMPAFASGGIAPGGLALVGERGPELVSLPRGARVYNNREAQRIVVDSQGGGGPLVGSLTVNWHSPNRPTSGEAVDILQTALREVKRRRA